MRILSAVLLAGAMLAELGCAPSITVNHDYDTEADFTALRTFRWLPQPTTATGTVQAALRRNSLLDSRVKRAVNRQLEAKGYKQEAGDADFLLMYHAGARDKINVTDWGYGYGPYGRRFGGGISVYQYQEGTLILDIIDAKTMQLVWRGSAQGTIDPRASTAERERRLDDAVTKMLMQFPPPKP